VLVIGILGCTQWHFVVCNRPMCAHEANWRRVVVIKLVHKEHAVVVRFLALPRVVGP
jgi:hypothetical protein